MRSMVNSITRGGSPAVCERYPVTGLVFALLAVTGCAGRLHMPGFVHPVEESARTFESQEHTIRVDAYVPEGRGQRHPTAIVLHGSGGIHLVGG